MKGIKINQIHQAFKPAAHTLPTLPAARVFIELFPSELSMQRMRGIFRMLESRKSGLLNAQKTKLRTPTGKAGYIWTPSAPTKRWSPNPSSRWASVESGERIRVAHSLKLYLIIRQAHCDAAVEGENYNLLTHIHA